jgi:hypothetical protein
MRGGERSFKSRVWDGQGGGVGVKVVLAVASWSAPERDLSGVGPVDKGGSGHAQDALGELSRDPALFIADIWRCHVARGEKEWHNNWRLTDT